MKKNIFIISCIFFFSHNIYSQKSQGIGTNIPNPRAVLELNSEDAINFPQGLLMPRLTTAQRLALGTVAGLPAGMSVYDNTELKFYVWNAPGWTAMGSGSASQWTTSGVNIYYTGGNVGVGSSNAPDSRLSIQSLGNSSTTSALNIVNSAGLSILYMRDDGMMGINNTMPGYHLHVNGRIKSNGLNETSDSRLKTDIVNLSNVLQKVLQLQGVSYRMRDDALRQAQSDKRGELKKEIGLLAQEVEKLFPELVHTDGNGYKSLEYSRIVAILIEAIKEQEAHIIRLEKNVNAYSILDAKLEKVKAEMETLKKEYPVKSEK